MDVNYDEDISENPFFQTLERDYGSILVRAIKNDWIICVPRRESFISTAVREDDIIQHVLIPNDAESTSKFYTLGGKVVKLANRTLTLEGNDVGIKSPCSSYFFFEETFYTKDKRKYRIWCIDRPLIHHLQIPQDDITVVKDLTECIELLQSETGAKSLRELESTIENFRKTSMYLENTSLDDLKDSLMQLYAGCLEIICNDSKLKSKLAANPNLSRNINLSIETYILHDLREILWRLVNTVTACEDACLNKIIRNVNDLQFKDLGVRMDLYESAQRGKLELARLNNFATSLGKIHCLRKSVHYIFQKHISSDDLLPVLIFFIIKIGLPNWSAQIIFMKHFRFSTNLLNVTDEADYLITSLEAAVEYVKSGKLARFTQREDKDGNSCSDANSAEGITLNNLFSCIKQDNLSELNKLLVEYSKPEPPDLQLCHPLCTCESCETNLAQNSISNRLTVRSKDEKGWTLLHVASYHGHISIVDYLINQGSDVDDADTEGVTPLHCASAKGHQKTVLLLLHRSADPTLTDNRGNNALHVAADHGHENCVKALLYLTEQLRIPLSPNSGNLNMDTPLHYASKWGYLGIVKILMEYGANCMALNKRGQTPFTVAHNSHIANALQRKKSQNILILQNPQNDTPKL